MALAPKTKLKIILVAMAAIVLLVVLNPFLIASGLGSFSEEVVQAVFLILEFLAVAYLWNEFNRLRIIINEKELEDQTLVEIEHDVEKLTALGSSPKNKKD